MVKISAFQSLRPIQKLVKKVSTQAYSNYSKEEIELELMHNQYSFLNIIAKNQAKNLKIRFEYVQHKIDEFKAKNILKKEQEKSIYIYRQSKNGTTYTGLICAVEVKDYKERKIKIHEQTIEKRELLFSKYLSITKIHAEPVLLTYNNNTQYVTENYISPQNKLYDFKNRMPYKFIQMILFL